MIIAYRGLALGALVLGAFLAATPSSPAFAADAPYANEKAKAERAAATAPAARPAPASSPKPTPAAVPGVPAPKALQPDIAGECAWTGKRVIGLLARDDVDTAKRFLEFYTLFNCRQAHLAPVMRCMILETTNAPPEEAEAARVDRCWSASSL